MTKEEKAAKILEALTIDDETEKFQTEMVNKIDTLSQQINSIMPALEILTNYFVLQQKDFLAAKGISADALRSKIMSGEVDFLQSDGSRINYIPLRASNELKPRSRRKKN